MTPKPKTGNPNHKGYCKYTEDFHDIDFRKEPHRYKPGIGEQGVFMTRPYSTEIRDHWRFRTPAIARESARVIYSMFEEYLAINDYVGADTARKFLMMGWTRSRRYANHPSGTKWSEGKVIPQAEDSQTSDKAECARIFKAVYDKARTNTKYLSMREAHKKVMKEQLDR